LASKGIPLVTLIYSQQLYVFALTTMKTPFDPKIPQLQ